MVRSVAKRRRGLPLEDLFDGFGRFTLAEACAVRDAKDVGVDGEGLGPERDIKHHVCRLAPDTGELLEQVTIGRNFAAILIDKDLRKRDDVLCFVIEKANGADVTAHGRSEERRVGKEC